MDIFILRHGDANPATKKLMSDSKRGLSDSGIKEIENVSELFAKFEIKFDYIFSSPLMRAKQSTDVISKNQKKSKIVELADLKPEGSVEEVCKKIAKQKENSTILIIGHNPFLVNLINYIINSVNSQNLTLKTGGLVKIKALSLEPQLKGELEWLLAPKLIRKISK
jgi:phosphohistidine phosphatase